MLPAKGLPSVWLKGCKTDEEKKARDQLIRSSQSFITLFLSILSDKYNSIERKGLKEEDYKDTNWVFLQAYQNGRLSELNDVGELFSFMGTQK